MAGKGSSTFNISLRLLDQNFKKGISGIQKQIRGLGNFIRGAFAIGSITAFGRQMIQVATDFEDAMARVKAVSNASASDLQMMTEEARKMGATTRYTATEAANALENLTRNGMSASQATQALAGTLQLAQANAIGLAESADIVSNTLNMFGLAATEVTRVNDVLSAVASTTATNVSEIYAALVNAAPAAVSLGISLEETAAAVGAFAQMGVKAEQAGTNLRSALLTMVDPKIGKKMEAAGVSIDENVIKTEGLIGAVKRLSDANLSTSQAMEIFGRKSGNAILQLVSAYDTLQLELEITKNSAGTTHRMFEMGVGTTRAAIDTLKSTYEAFLLTLGQKSNTVFNGVLDILTKLIRNFNNVGGTLWNIASVIVPLFTKRLVTMFTTFSTGSKKAAADAVKMKVAMGDWITLVATAVTWLGTYVYSLGSARRELQDLNKEYVNNSRETENLRKKTNELLEILGPDTDLTTLAGVTKKLTDMFPDFKQQIMDAATEAGKTEEWEKLKKVMEDVVDLQDRALKNNTLAKALTNYTEIIAAKMQRAAKAPGSEEGSLDAEIRSAYKSFYGSIDEGGINSVWKAFATVILESQTSFEAIDNAMKYVFEPFEAGGQFFRKRVEGVIGNWFNQKDVAAGAQRFREYQTNQTKIDNAKKAEAEAAKKAAKTQKDLEREAEEEERKNNERKNRAKSIADVEKHYKEAIEDAEDDYRRAGGGADALKEKLLDCARAATKAYEEFRGLTRKTGKDNPYEEKEREAAQALKAAGLYPSAVSTSGSLIGPNQITYPYIKRGDKNVNKNQLKDANRPAPGPFPYTPPAFGDLSETEWKDYAVWTDEAITATSMFANSLSSLQSAFDTLSSKDATWIDKLSASTRILETMEDAIIGVVKIIGDLGDTELLGARKEAIASALSRKNKKKDIAADTTKAVTGAAASQSGIPYIGPILAIAAVATILGLIAASSQKFAKGGIVQGNTKYGDKLLARVNAGEAILNQRQQKRLLDIADGRSGSGNIVGTTIVHGKDLEIVFRNINKANERIAGSKGM